MSHPLVINIRRTKDVSYVLVGRVSGSRFHFGNPFSHLSGTLAAVRVKTREEAISSFKKWLAGTHFKDIEQDRRQWIIDHLYELKGKTLGCFCAPLACHAEVLAWLAERI